MMVDTAMSWLSSPGRIGFRLLVLFSCGSVAFVALNLLRLERRTALLWLATVDVGRLVGSPWWAAPSFGFYAALVGMLYPFLDKRFGLPPQIKADWTNWIRCCVMFVGVSHASVKFGDLEHRIQFLLLLLCVVFAMWWMFDHSANGLGIAIVTTLVGTAATIIVAHVLYRHSDFVTSKVWLPCLYFAGACTFGNLGRQLAVIDHVISYPASFVVTEKLHND